MRAWPDPKPPAVPCAPFGKLPWGARFFPVQSVRPTAWLLLWAVAAVALQRLAAVPLLLATGAFLALAGTVDAARLYRLVRRSRWLLLAMGLLFGWMTPGIYLVPDLGAASPTREGLLQGLEHAGRLLGLVAMVALLLARWTPAQLVQALAGLMAPWRHHGQRAALRLALVLDYVEQVPPAHQWRQWLGAPPSVDSPASAAAGAPARATFLDALWLLVPLVLLWLN